MTPADIPSITCEDAAGLIGARVDGEIAPVDAARLEGHLSNCGGCRALAEAMKQQDADLEQAFLARGSAAEVNAERAIGRIARTRLPVRRFRPWMTVLASAAAGFLVAMVVFHPWRKVAPVGPTASTTRPVLREPVARLALATGLIEVCPSEESTWSALPTGGAILPGTRVRTGERVRCEFETPDGSEIRLNANTEARFTSSRDFDLTQGQAWSMVAHAAAPFEVHAATATFTALGTQFDLSCAKNETRLTVVEGSVKVNTPGAQQLIKSGQGVNITDGAIGQPRGTDLLTTTAWVNELLRLKGHDNAELNARVNDLLSRLGQTKMEELNDQEIRALGDHCVVPLTKYVQSERSHTSPYHREAAARILADLAEPWSIPDLIALLGDEQANVRFYAAMGLRRVTGTDLGYEPEKWRGDRNAESEEAIKKWQQWWKNSADRFPRAPVNTKAVPVTRPI